jgi:hypothetical protein
LLASSLNLVSHRMLIRIGNRRPHSQHQHHDFESEIPARC